MKKILFMIYTALIVIGLSAGGPARAQVYPPESGGYLFTAEELDELLAPIALYPDPLLAQILPAATFIDQIDEAARYVRQYGKYARIDDQPWDVSVRAVAHYPDILFMMDQKSDWTAALGQAFINQEQDVMDAIQRLRAEAEDAGNLASTDQQEVYDEDDSIRIVPANPDMIYVPQYDPSVIYVEPSPPYGFITFSIGFVIGAWLDRDCDWHRHRVYYHGWQGGGWIGRSRPHIHDRRNIYINNNNKVIALNRTVIRHDTANFREDLRYNAQRRQQRVPTEVRRPQVNQPEERAGAHVATPRPSPTIAQPVERTRAREETPRPVPGAAQPAEQAGARLTTPRPSPGVAQPAEQTGARVAAPHPAPAPVAPRPPAQPAGKDFYRGREIPGPQPAARSGYGGYGSGQDAAIYRQRGQASRENMGGANRQPQLPVQAPRPVTPQRPPGIQPAPRPAAPAAPAVPRQAPPSGHGGGHQREHR